MAEKTPENAVGTGKKTPETVADLREAVDQKIDDLFGGLDDDEDDEPTLTVLQEGAEIELPQAAPVFDADRSKPPAATAPRKPPAEPPADSKTVERPAAPVTVPPPQPRPDPPKAVATPPPEPPGPAAAPSKKTERKGIAERSAQPKPGSTRPPKVKKPVTAPARKAGKAKATPLLGRILLWGAVLGVVVCTVVYFKSYESKTPPPSTAESGMFFYKVAPSKMPAAGPVSVPSAATAPTASAAKPASTDKKPNSVPPATVNAYVERSYPWGIHIASYRDVDFAKKKMAQYRRGVHAFLVYTDLGDKGIWYRLYFGHFPDATSAVDAIKKYGLKDAVAGHIRYACLMGSYASEEAARATADRLSAKGFLPYTIVIKGTHHVLVGAHPTEGGVETVHGELKKAGFSGKVIKR